MPDSGDPVQGMERYMTMMNKRIRSAWTMTIMLLCAVVMPCLQGTAASEDNRKMAIVAGVEFDDVIELGPERLVIEGAGLHRYMIVLKGYAAALYLGQGHSSDELFDDIPKCLQIVYFHAIPAQGFVRATQHGFEANLAPEDLEGLKDQIGRLYECYQDVKKQDRYSFIYHPSTGPELQLNGEILCRFDSLQFANAVLSIWLGENPLDKRLKEDLLGRK